VSVHELLPEGNVAGKLLAPSRVVMLVGVTLWTGTVKDGSTAPTNIVTLDAGDRFVGVTNTPVTSGHTHLYLPTARRYRGECGVTRLTEWMK
jgi:hypothetical protein